MALPSKSGTVGIFLVREHREFSEVSFLQSDGGTVLSEENRVYEEYIFEQFEFDPFSMDT